MKIHDSHQCLENNPVPIAIFCFNRLDHLVSTIDALRQNSMAEVSPLFIFSDGARNDIEREAVDAVRRYIGSLEGFGPISITYRECNYGLAKSIISGVTTVLKSFDRIIVLEDDMVSSPHFLCYMNEALDKYSQDDRVACVHGYTYPCESDLPEAFFLKGADCWGWGTWRREWELFCQDGQLLLAQIESKNLQNEFDYDGSYRYTKMLKDQIMGKNNSWAIRWYASSFLQGKLCLYPGRSLIHNIGNDDSGTHSQHSTIFDTRLSASRIDISNLDVSISEPSRQAFVRYFRKVHGGFLSRGIRFLKAKLT